MPAAALTALVVAGSGPAHAATVDVFLIADHSAPVPSSTAPFSITTTKVYQLGLNGAQRGTSATVVDNFTFNVQTPLTFNNDEYNNGVFRDPTNVTDQGETGEGTAALVNSEVASWDNVNIPGRGANVNIPGSSAYDSAKQIDFGRNAPVIFNPVTGGFTELVVAELGGFNPFDLWLCDDALCSTLQKVFGGVSDTLARALDSTPDFAFSDTAPESELDQTWLFRFDAPVYGFARVLENDRRGLYGNERLQVDFIGAGGVSMPAVPGPAGLPLLASGLGLLGFMLRRRKA